MKKLRIWSMLMLMAMAMPMMVACGGDESDDVGTIDINELIGHWYCLENTIKSGEYQADNWYQGAILNIRTNGTITSTSLDFIMTGRYTISNNFIVITPENDRKHYFRVSISGDRMTWHESSDNQTATYVFEKAETAVKREVTPYGTWVCTWSYRVHNSWEHAGLFEGDEVVFNIDGTYTSTLSSFGTTGTFNTNGRKSVIATSNMGKTFNLLILGLNETDMELLYESDGDYQTRYLFSRKVAQAD